ncbi:MAG: sulfurtransferase TusA family protein [Rubrivivax sp.]|nr:sulfurtransferase TusA family protein [Rubrivivax sp.]
MTGRNWWARLSGRAPLQPKPAATAVVEVPGNGLMPIAQSVDCLGAMCPRPQLLTMKVLNRVSDGDVVEVRCDSAPAVESFPALALTLACTHLATVRDAQGWRVYLRKGC